MPIAKLVKGGRLGWESCDRYITTKAGAKIISSNMGGTTVAQRTAEYKFFSELNRRAKNTVLHISISPHPEDEIDDDLWRQIASDVRCGLGYDDNQYLLATHSDTGLLHAHLLLNRVTMTGEVPNDLKDKRHAETIMRQVEQEYDLTPVTSSWETERSAPNTGQSRRFERERAEYEIGKRTSPPSPPVLAQLQDIIDLAVFSNPTFSSFVEQLESEGVNTRVSISSDGVLQGISYCKDGVPFRGSDLGRKGSPYTLSGLRDRGLTIGTSDVAVLASIAVIASVAQQSAGHRDLPPVDEVASLIGQQLKKDERTASILVPKEYANQLPMLLRDIELAG